MLTETRSRRGKKKAGAPRCKDGLTPQGSAQNPSRRKKGKRVAKWEEWDADVKILPPNKGGKEIPGARSDLGRRNGMGQAGGKRLIRLQTEISWKKWKTIRKPSKGNLKKGGKN